MTVTIKDVMPQGIETMGEREVGNNIGNNGNVGIEMGNADGEAVGMGVQSSNRRRKEKERKNKQAFCLYRCTSNNSECIQYCINKE